MRRGPYRPWQEHEIDFLRAHLAKKGARWCSNALDRDLSSVYAKALQYDLRTPRKEKVEPVLPKETPKLAQHSTRYSPQQLDALDVIGTAYTKKVIDFDFAVKLRDLVRSHQIDKALSALVAAQEEAA